MVADRHRLAAYHNTHCWRAFRGYQHRWPWMTLNPKNRRFKSFCWYFRLRRTLRVNFRWNILEIDQDNLRTKLNWCCGASHEHYCRTKPKYSNSRNRNFTGDAKKRTLRTVYYMEQWVFMFLLLVWLCQFTLLNCIFTVVVFDSSLCICPKKLSDCDLA